MIEYIIATNEDVELLMKSRLEMLRVVNELPSEYEFSKDLLDHSLEYFMYGNQTTVLSLSTKVCKFFISPCF